MRGPATSVGALAGLVSPSASRIPHLKAHIFLRRSRQKAQGTSFGPPARHGFLSQSTWATIHASEADVKSKPSEQDENYDLRSSLGKILAYNHTAEREGTREAQGTDTSEAAAVQVHDVHGVHGAEASAANTLQLLLEEGCPERVLFGLLDASIGPAFIHSADTTSFNKALELLDFKYLHGQFKEVYRFIKPSLMTQPLYRNIRPLEERFKTFAADLDYVVHVRKEAGHRLDLDAFRHLLNNAQVMGDGPMATYIFDTLMPQDGVEPDLSCYNSMMEALCWSHAYSKAEQWSLRVYPHHLQLRALQRPPLKFSGHRVDRESSGKPKSTGGLRVTLLTRFRELVSHGFHGDENTFTNVMIAMGREGDLEGAKSILKSVWNVDVDLLSTYDEEEIEGPTFYESDSPLRPSSRLLFTVVHVFGSNNNVGLAFTLIDYISRNYNLEIPPDVWLELCEWTFVLSIRRSRQKRESGQNLGSITSQVFERLWQVMTDQPHNIVPDVPLLALRSRNFLEEKDVDGAIESLRQARILLDKGRDEVEQIAKNLLDLIEDQTFNQTNFQSGFLSKSFLDDRRAFTLASQRFDRDLQLLIVALRQIFENGARFYLEEDVSLFRHKQAEWERRRLPDLLNEFAEFLPNETRYKTSGGKVWLNNGKRHRHNLLRRWGSHGHFLTTQMGVMRFALDTDDHTTLLRGIETLRAGSNASMRTLKLSLGQSDQRRNLMPRDNYMPKP